MTRAAKIPGAAVAARLALAALAAVLLGAPSAAAVEPRVEPLRVEALEVRDHPAVRLTVSMPPSLHGRVIPPESFEVEVAGEPVAADVQRVSTERLRVVLAIDTSGSMRGEPIAASKRAAAAFVGDLPETVEVAVVAFGEEATVVSPFTSERADVGAAIAGLTVGGETALYDGLKTATMLFEPGEGVRNVVVMLSDGGDTVSASSLEDAIVALLETETRFYAVELQSPENDPEPLQRLGAATEGRVVPVEEIDALEAIFVEVAASIVNQYEITFETSAYGLTEVQVDVVAGGVTARLLRLVRFPPSPRLPAAPPTPAVAVPAPAPAELPAPRAGFTVSVGFLGSGRALWLGLAVLVVGGAGLLAVLLRGSRRVRLAAADAASLLRTRSDTPVGRLTERFAAMAERSLERQGRKGKLELALDAAGTAMRPGEFVVLVLGLAFGAYVAGLFTISPLVGVIFAVATVIGFWYWLTSRVDRRRKAFVDQLAATLQLMAGSLRAGFGLLQALEVVAEEAPSPTAEEFHRVKVETHLGRDLVESLRALRDRVGGDDFEWVVEGVEIHRRIGGDLSEILEKAAETIRERARLRRQVKALSAEGRMSAVVLVLIPIAIAGVMSVTNPEYLAELTGSPLGHRLIIAAIVLLLVGSHWMRRLIDIEY